MMYDDVDEYGDDDNAVDEDEYDDDDDDDVHGHGDGDSTGDGDSDGAVFVCPPCKNTMQYATNETCPLLHAVWPTLV